MSQRKDKKKLRSPLKRKKKKSLKPRLLRMRKSLNTSSSAILERCRSRT